MIYDIICNSKVGMLSKSYIYIYKNGSISIDFSIGLRVLKET